MKLTLPLPPSHNAMYRAVNGRVLKSKEYREWIADCVVHLMLAKGDMIEGDCSVTLHIKYRDRRRDCDSAIKPTLDVLQGTAYENDRQVREIHAYGGIDKESPCVVVTIDPMGVP